MNEDCTFEDVPKEEDCPEALCIEANGSEEVCTFDDCTVIVGCDDDCTEEEVEDCVNEVCTFEDVPKEEDCPEALCIEANGSNEVCTFVVCTVRDGCDEDCMEDDCPVEDCSEED